MSTLKSLIKLANLIDDLDGLDTPLTEVPPGKIEYISLAANPMLGRRCLIRTYSAGVHIGTVAEVNGMEARLTNALRLWKWEGGGLSLSAVANNGIKGGRLNKTGEVYLTNVIEIIPTTDRAEATFSEFIEDED